MLLNILARQGMPRKFVEIIPPLYLQTQRRLRVYAELSKSFPTRSGVRQGCPLSPFLFNFVIDEIMRQTLKGLQNPGVHVRAGEKLVDLEYADDVVLLFEDVQEAQSVLDKLHHHHHRQHYIGNRCTNASLPYNHKREENT